MKKICCIVIMVLVSCSAPRITFDYDKSLSFDQFTTYNYYPELITGMNELDDKRLFFKVDSILQTKGFSKVENPELFLNVTATRFEAGNPFSVNLGVGSVGRRGGVGVSGGVPVGGTTLNEELLFDIIDTEKNELIWQGRSEKRVPNKTTPLAREQYFGLVVAKVFEKFPPKKK
ncbi:DUF4136 domain-containing protein [Ascidiimonas sp. W6]|uniref:DUF4136 domain-containing protein n=1 Tax=Ascidiimonas meishanensis TaxID=3128903 RepID=UPI0030EC9998